MNAPLHRFATRSNFSQSCCLRSGGNLIKSEFSNNHYRFVLFVFGCLSFLVSVGILFVLSSHIYLLQWTGGDLTAAFWLCIWGMLNFNKSSASVFSAELQMQWSKVSEQLSHFWWDNVIVIIMNSLHHQWLNTSGTRSSHQTVTSNWK